MTDNAGGYVVAVDVGGTLMKGGIANLRGDFVYRTRRPTRTTEGVNRVVEGLLEFIEGLINRAQTDREPLIGIGIAVPGLVDEYQGIALSSTNIGWKDIHLRDLVQSRFGIPVAVGHDVRAGALAEARRGAGRGHPNFLFVPIGTGIAAAIVINGRPFPGDSFAAGEIGHIPVDANGPLCACGNRGCLESIAAAPAIARRYGAMTHRASVDASSVTLALDKGDPIARLVWIEAVEALSHALSLSAILYDVTLNVIGGGLATAGDRLFVPLRDALNRNRYVGTPPVVAPALLGDEAGCVGAALLIADELSYDHEGTVKCR